MNGHVSYRILAINQGRQGHLIHLLQGRSLWSTKGIRKVYCQAKPRFSPKWPQLVFKKLKTLFYHHKKTSNCQIPSASHTNREIWKSLKAPANSTGVKMTNVHINWLKAKITLHRCADDLAKSGVNKEPLTRLM